MHRTQLAPGVSARRRATLLITALVVSLATACGSGAAPPQDPQAQALDQAVTATLAQASIPGAIIGVWRPGHPLYERAFGVADKATGAPMRPDFYSRIGSETKTFTVTGALQLVDQHKVGLDDPIGKYISGVPAGDKVTVRELAEMRSGLFNYSADPGFVRALVTDPRRPFTPQELLGYAFKHPLMFDPGTNFFYSNTNTILLGLLVEKLSGQPLPAYIRDHVLSPLHMNHTQFPSDGAFPDPHAQGYTDTSLDGKVTTATDWNPSWGWAAGAMISTLDDLHVWAPAVATGTLLSPATQAERLKADPVTGAPGAGYGLGIFNVDGWIGHNGSLPGYQSLTIYLPAQNTTVVVLLNTDISYQGNEPSTLVGKAITSVISPGNVYSLPAQTQTPEQPPTSSAIPAAGPR